MMTYVKMWALRPPINSSYVETHLKFEIRQPEVLREHGDYYDRVGATGKNYSPPLLRICTFCHGQRIAPAKLVRSEK